MLGTIIHTYMTLVESAENGIVSWKKCALHYFSPNNIINLALLPNWREKSESVAKDHADSKSPSSISKNGLATTAKAEQVLDWDPI